MPEPQQPTRPRPTPTPRMVLCPFCGSLTASMERCGRCGGRFDPLSRQASQNAMGPWFIRDESRAFMPGCSYETIRQLISRGRIRPTTVMRGPTTNQFWTLAKRTPGIAHLLGGCHNCEAPVEPTAYACERCGAVFGVDADRQHLGLAPMQMLPGEAPPAVIAAMSGPPLPTEPLEVTRSGGPGVEGPRRRGSVAPPPQPVDVGQAPQATTGEASPSGRRWMAAAAIVLAVLLGALAMGGVLYAVGALETTMFGGPPSPPAVEEGAAPVAEAGDGGAPQADAAAGVAASPEEGGPHVPEAPVSANDGGDSEVFALLRDGSDSALGTAIERLRTTGVPPSGRTSEPSALEEAVRLRLEQRSLRRIP